MRALAIWLATLLAAGCLQVSWQRDSRHAPVSKAALDGLAAGTGLDECLGALGAPLWVWEHVEGGTPGAALAYGWFDQKDVGLRFSVPVTEYYSVSLDYDQIDLRMKGLVLFFDADWRLTSWRTGLLRDLSREAQRRPAFVEASEPEGGS
jgi:hypothetical protein